MFWRHRAAGFFNKLLALQYKTHESEGAKTAQVQLILTPEQALEAERAARQAGAGGRGPESADSSILEGEMIEGEHTIAPAPEPRAREGSLPYDDQPTIGHIGRYALKYRLGEGGLGTVYAAQDPLLSRLVAIKTVSLELSPEARRRCSVRTA